jgi:predicted metal-dependent HD superfamily phosphohydrolase
VYDGERDAEERSAVWAEEALPGLTDAATVAEVVRLVRLTESHWPDDADANGCALSDADLGILAAPQARYDEYVAAVRAEYSHLSDPVFIAGRAAVLRDLAAKPKLFHTAHGHARWEEPARRNIERELSLLAV